MGEQSVQTKIAVLTRTQQGHGKRIEKLEAKEETFQDLAVSIGELKTWLKVTWGILFLMIGSVFSVAVSMWK